VKEDLDRQIEHPYGIVKMQRMIVPSLFAPTATITLLFLLQQNGRDRNDYTIKKFNMNLYGLYLCILLFFIIAVANVL
jgi:hypothetical protein